MTNFDHQSGSTLRLQGADIYYEFQGKQDAPVILFLHGGFGTMSDFNPILEGLGDYRLLGIDSRGHGKSTLGSAKLTYEQLERDALAVLEHLSIPELSIVGFSDGGTVALRLAALSKLNLSRLVTVGATWHNDHSASLHDIFVKITGPSWRAKFPEMVEDYERWNPQPDFDHFVKVGMEMWMDPTDTAHPNERVERIDCPTLVVRGDEDHLVQVAWCTELQDSIEDSHFLNIPRAGHVTFADQPELFVACLRPFLEGDWD